MTHLSSWSLLFIVYGAINVGALFVAMRGLSETKPGSTQRVGSPISWSRLIGLGGGPASSIVIPSRTTEISRYHHPEVTYRDVAEQRSQ